MQKTAFIHHEECMQEMTKIPIQKKSGIPLLGLGTWKLLGKECEKVIQTALELGYRHIDTADLYNNHHAIGKVIQSVPRKDLFLVSKIYLDHLSPENVEQVVPRFLDELRTDYLDLLLIHWPHPTIAPELTLQAMLEFKKKGSVKSIGVSNFVRSHLNHLAPYHFPILTNQIEMHPYLQRKELVQECKKNGITVTAYRPLAKGAFDTDATLQQIGVKYDKSPAQIALRWLVQQDIVAIPKAAKWDHLKENMEIFDFTLDKEDLKKIDTLDSGARFCSPEGIVIPED